MEQIFSDDEFKGWEDEASALGISTENFLNFLDPRTRLENIPDRFRQEIKEIRRDNPLSQEARRELERIEEIRELETKEETKEETKDDLSDESDRTIVDQALQHLESNDGILPFEEGNFNINHLVKLFEENSDIDVIGLPEDDFLNTGKADQYFANLVHRTLKRVLQSKDPKQLLKFKKTLAIVSSKVEQGRLGYSPSKYIEDVIHVDFPIEKYKKMVGKVFHPVNIGNLIETIFSTELKDLQKRNLSQDEIKSIRSEFKEDLKGLEDSIGQDYIYGQNTFRMLQNYINNTVDNNQLRQLLLGDIQVEISLNKQKLGIQLGENPPILTPLSATRTQILRKPHAENVARVFGDTIEEINEAQKRIDKSKRDPTRLRATQATRVRDAVQIFNDFAIKNNITDPKTRLPIRIETQREEKIDDDIKDPDASRGSIARIVPEKTEMLIGMLKDLTEKLNRGTLSFEYIPTLIRDPHTGNRKESIIRDIVNMERAMKNKSKKVKKPKKKLLSSMHKRAKFANASVLTAKRRIQRDIHGNTNMGSKMREIRISSNITLGELAKIANMIAMEDGSLEDIHQQPLLDIRKGITPIQEIVNSIMIAQKHAGGNDFSVIFVPLNPIGGLHLGGSLDVIHKNRMLVSPLEKPLYYTSMHRDVPSTHRDVVGGSVHQAEPLSTNNIKDNRRIDPTGRTGGDNQIFRIQSRSTMNRGLGGHINNTGFIDQSQMNPKFPWMDVPIISLTSFG